MKALLLAAGLGTRLLPFTLFRAKPSLPLLNVPFIRYPLQYLANQNIDEVVINLHAHPESVQKAVEPAKNRLKIHYSFEPDILGTGGAMWKAKSMLGDEPFVVMNSDMLTTIPFAEVLRQHQQTGAWVTLVVIKSPHYDRYGGLYFDEGPLRLKGTTPDCGDFARYHYTGLQIVNPEVMQLIPPERKSEIFTDIYPQLISEEKIFGFSYDGLWKEIGTLREYLKTSLEILSNPLPDSFTPDGVTPSLIHPQARVEPGAVVNDSIVMEGARIPAGIQVDQCIIGWETTVDKNYRNASLLRGVLPWYIS